MKSDVYFWSSSDQQDYDRHSAFALSTCRPWLADTGEMGVLTCVLLLYD